MMKFLQTLFPSLRPKAPANQKPEEAPAPLVTPTNKCIAKICGHLFDPGKYTVRLPDGGKGTWTLQKDHDYCITCLLGMTVPCGRCGECICIGDPVSLPILQPGTVTRHESVMLDGNRSVQCLRCNLASEVSGRWLPGENGKGMVGAL